MRTKYLYFSFLVFLFSIGLSAREYSSADKRLLYAESKPKERSSTFLLKRTDQAWLELNMPALAKALDRTKSVAGAVEFERLLQPTSNLKELESRRVIIETLMRDTALFDQLNNRVEQFALEYEGLFAHFLDANGRLLFVLETPSPFGSASSLLSLSSTNQLYFQSFMTALLIQGLGYEFRQIRHNFADARNPTLPGYERRWLGYNLIGHSLGLGYMGLTTVSNTLSTVAKVNEADGHVMQTAEALALASSIENILRTSPLATSEIAAAFFAFHDPKTMSDEFSDALVALKDRLGAENSWLRVLSTFKSLDTYDNLQHSAPDLLKVVQAFAILDAYLSVVKLYKEWSAKGASVSLASFTSSNEVSFSFTELGNPLISNAVTNDFSLGVNSPTRHAVITGPHGCGKTTMMKSAAYGFILGQSILVVPAKKAEFAPLNVLKTYFNVGDNILEGLSSFMSEHHRVAELSKMALHIRKGDRALFLVDEPYAKTIQTIGEPRVTDFMRQMSVISGLSVVLSTHFEEPSHLETETKGLIKNFQPELDQHLDPTYRIIDGAATWWFHDVARRNQFIDKLLQ